MHTGFRIYVMSVSDAGKITLQWMLFSCIYFTKTLYVVPRGELVHELPSLGVCMFFFAMITGCFS